MNDFYKRSFGFICDTIIDAFNFFHFEQVIPPKEWQAHSKTIDSDYVLSTVVNQSANNLLLGGLYLTTDHSTMPYGEFEAMAIQQGSELCEMSIDEIEEAHWAKICTKRKYAISNNLSLFGDCVKLWNLNSFTTLAKQNPIYTGHDHTTIRIMSSKVYSHLLYTLEVH